MAVVQEQAGHIRFGGGGRRGQDKTAPEEAGEEVRKAVRFLRERERRMEKEMHRTMGHQ